MQKVVILDGYASNPGDLSFDEFSEFGQLSVYDITTSENVIERLQGCTCAITNKTTLGRREFEACPELKYVGVLATGYNVVDIEAAKKFGVTVTYVPAYSTRAVAQHVFALLLEITNGVGVHNASVQSGKWCKSKCFCYWEQPLHELEGKTMGIVGTGEIGSATARLARAFGMEVICTSRTQKSELKDEGFNYVSMDELFARADVISLHCALTPDTQEIICKESIAKMKEGVIIINTARGGLVCERGLAEALEENRVFAFAADVVSEEPINENNPLLGAKNCILTPHIAWAPKQTRARLISVAADNLRSYLKGTPINTVT